MYCRLSGSWTVSDFWTRRYICNSITCNSYCLLTIIHSPSYHKKHIINIAKGRAKDPRFQHQWSGKGQNHGRPSWLSLRKRIDLIFQSLKFKIQIFYLVVLSINSYEYKFFWVALSIHKFLPLVFPR